MTKSIAITFDDAPLYGGPLLTGEERTQMLIEALAALGVEVTFYATPHDFDIPGSYERLLAYNDAGHIIANHTNDHTAASETDPAVFLSDVADASALLSEFSNYRPWFRFPFLDEGTPLETRDAYRDGLAELGLGNGYVTVDTFDWYINDKLAYAIETGGYYDLNAIRDAYVEMVVNAANHYEDMGQDLFGRSVAQVLLLHENDLAALFIGDVIAALIDDGWDIISSDEAYQDPLAEMVPDTLQTGRGQLAALAIDAGADPSILDHEGNTVSGLEGLLGRHDAFEIGDAPIEGTVGNDELFGSDSDDVFIGLAGDDVMVGMGGDDLYFGDDEGNATAGAYDQVNYTGALADYAFSANPDGSVSVTKPGGGIDTLWSIEGFWFFGEGAWYSLEDALAATPAGNVINGTIGNDVLEGTAQNDIISGLAGVDVIEASAGNDIIDGGGDEYDQVDYTGNAADYGFVRNADGSVSVTKPGGGVDLLTNIDGFWFSGEGVWYSLDDVAPPDPTGSIITGTVNDDLLFGLAGDDIIYGLEGSDEIVGSAGNDVIDGGGAEYDQVDYSGASGDYVFTDNGDGTVSVAKPDGEDLLSHIDGIWFSGEAAWYSLDQLLVSDPVGGVIDGTSGDDYLVGAAGDDIISGFAGSDEIVGSGGDDIIDGGGPEYDQVDYDGALADYTFTANDNDTVTVDKPDGGVDILSQIDGFWFAEEQAWYSLSDALVLASGGGPINGTDGDDLIYGTAADDIIMTGLGSDEVVGSAGNDQISGDDATYDQVDYEGAFGDYVFARMGDGTIMVTKPDGGVDTLSSIDGFWFIGTQEWMSADDIATLI